MTTPRYSALPRGLPRVQVGPGQERLVGEHLLEVGHEPAGVGRVAAEAADEVVVDAAGGHGVERPQRHVAGVRRRRRRHGGPGAGTARRGSGRGNFGAGPKPPHSGSKPAPSPATTCSSDGVGVERRSAAGRPEQRPQHRRRHRRRRGPPAAASLEALGQAELLAHGADERVGLREDLRPLADPRLAQRLHDAAERGHAVALDGREVRPGVEGAPVGRAEDGHGPAARARQGLGGRHVDGVEIGPLLPVDLDRDEPPGQVGRRRRVLEALVRHDVAPVARGVADGEEDRLVLLTGPAQCLVPPGDTTPPDCRRAGGDTGSSRRPGGSRERC